MSNEERQRSAPCKRFRAILEPDSPTVARIDIRNGRNHPRTRQATTLRAMRILDFLLACEPLQTAC